MQFRHLLLLAVLTFISAQKMLDRFEDWVRQYKVGFAGEQHYIEVYSKWSDNDLYIEEINSRNLTYTLGHNQFSGMSLIEYIDYVRTGSNRLEKSIYAEQDVIVSYNEMLSGESLRAESCGTGVCNDKKLRGASLPESVDWTEKGAVTPVKDQGQCGSCWSFSTTGGLEGAYYIKYGALQSFSEQQLVDCDNFHNGGHDHGCNGGLMDNAFTWVGKNGGLCTESAYPYVSGTTKTAGTCQTTCKPVSDSKVSKYVDVAVGDSTMMAALAQQPVSIAIEADQKDFQLYKSGVFTGTCGSNLDHGVLAVGYGTLDGTDYYKVKNSWGTSWGLGGYILLGRGSSYNDGKGQCGMLMQGSYPVLV
jgi:C1A family cysteine protease